MTDGPHQQPGGPFPPGNGPQPRGGPFPPLGNPGPQPPGGPRGQASPPGKRPSSGGLPELHEAWLPREHSLHRPRHGGRQLTALICALVFFLTPALSWVFGARPAQIENRALTGFPSLSAGWGLFTGLSQWGTDQLTFRGGAIQAENGISEGVFGEQFPFDQGSNGQQTGPLPGNDVQPSRPAQPSGPQVGPGSGGGGSNSYTGETVVQGTDGWLYLGEDALAKCSPVQPLATTIQRLNELRTMVQNSGRQFVFVVAPDKSTMEPQNLPATYADKSCADAASPAFWSAITTQGGALDLRPTLKTVQAQIKHPIYYPLDTHWTDEGSLVMTRDVAEKLKPGVTRTWKTLSVGRQDKPADLPPLLGKTGSRSGNIYALAPSGQGDRARELPGPLGPPVHLRSQPETGTENQAVTVLGDSFTEGAARYLSAAFTNLTVMHYSVTQSNPQAAINAIVGSQVVVVEAVERSVAAGNVQFLDPSFLQALSPVLAGHPGH
jgi:alginate O-acetyltransferase complex protein AlgJ